MYQFGYSDGIELRLHGDSYRLIDRTRNLYHSVKDFFKKYKLKVKVNETECRTIGRIGMNYIAIDVTDIDAKIGDKVAIDVKPIYIQSNIRREYR